MLKKFGVGKDEISIVYEAGPSGFVLARRLLQPGCNRTADKPNGRPRKRHNFYTPAEKFLT